MDMTRFSIVGFAEIVLRYFFFRRLFRKIVAWIENHKPRVVCFVDYPGLNMRIAAALFEKKLSARAGGSIRLFYYVSPQVWAWREGRKFKLEKYVDSLATIFAFEKDVYKDTGLDVKYVGHPLADVDISKCIGYEKNGPILLLPGSRESAVKKIFPEMLKCFSLFSRNEPGKMATVIYASDGILAIMRKILNKKYKSLVSKVSFVADGRQVEARAALMSSGTMSLKCCLAGIPGAILYRSNCLTFALAKRMIKVKYIGIANVLLNRCAWPEYIQHAIDPKVISRYLLSCSDDGKVLERCRSDTEELRALIRRNPDMSPEEWLCSALE
jgi:lipid-A-disaccharide synthase